jgi:glycerophosphoryl diester phosphodiesterase
MSSAKEYSPFVIAHRGHCSLFPENTLESIEAAVHRCHYVEFDILLTRDEEIVIFHDRYLSELTNVAEVPEFADRKRTFVDDARKQEEREDWWVRDFTCEELKRLRINQKSPKRPQLRRLQMAIPTLAEAIEEILFLKERHIKDNTAGFLIELKGHQEYKEHDPRDAVMVKKLEQCLQRYGLSSREHCQERRFPIILQSFNHSILQTISKSPLQLPIVHLYCKEAPLSAEFLYQRLFPTSIGIAISIDHARKEVMDICKDKGLSVFFWTMKDD